MNNISVRLEAGAGARIEDVCIEMAEYCIKNNISAELKFNEIDIFAVPGDSYETLIMEYYDALKDFKGANHE